MNRMKAECGNCGRSFYQRYKIHYHICEENLSIFQKFQEWLTFRKVPEIEKFISQIGQSDPSLEARLSQAYKAWNESIPPGKDVAIRNKMDPIDRQECECGYRNLPGRILCSSCGDEL